MGHHRASSRAAVEPAAKLIQLLRQIMGSADNAGCADMLHSLLHQAEAVPLQAAIAECSDGKLMALIEP